MSAFKTNPAVRVIVWQLSGKNCLAAILPCGIATPLWTLWEVLAPADIEYSSLAVVLHTCGCCPCLHVQGYSWNIRDPDSRISWTKTLCKAPFFCCLRQGMAGLSRNLGRDVPGFGCARGWRNFSSLFACLPFPDLGLLEIIRMSAGMPFSETQTQQRGPS